MLPTILYKLEKYDTLLRLFPEDRHASMALYGLADEAYQVASSSDDNRIFIFPAGSSSYGQGNSKEERAYAKSILERLLQEYENLNNINAVKYNLAKLYMWENEWDKAELLFQELAISKNGAYNDVELQAFLDMLASRKPKPNKQSSLTGEIKIGDKPAANVFVVLHLKDDMGWSSSPYSHYPMAITDDKGQYYFYDIAPNDYEVGVGVTPEQIDGYYLMEPQEKFVTIASSDSSASAEQNIHFVPRVKTISPVNKELIEGDELRFEWAAYEGADYYQVAITEIFYDREGKSVGSGTRSLIDKHRGLTAIYSLSELHGYTQGSSKSYGSDDSVTLSVTGLLGVVYPGGDFIWSVDAYDRNGLKLSSSAGYFVHNFSSSPLFSIHEDGMLEGDRLVIKGQYEEAILAYKKEGDNDHALRVLGRLADQGITKEDGDPAEALAYLERIKEPNSSDEELIQHLREKLEKK